MDHVSNVRSIIKHEGRLQPALINQGLTIKETYQRGATDSLLAVVLANKTHDSSKEDIKGYKSTSSKTAQKRHEHTFNV